MKARIFAIAALVLGLASCAKDFAPEGNAGGEVNFSLEVSAPEFGVTRADKDSQAGHDSAFGAIDYLSEEEWAGVDLRYILEVYDAASNYADAEPIKDRQVQIVDKYEPVKFEVRLAPGRDYHFVVFADFVPQGATDLATVEAQEELGLRHKIGATLGDITFKKDAITGKYVDAINDEYADAYFATLDYTPSHNTHNTAEPIVLRRPYAKVRVIATDLHELNLNVDPKAVKVSYAAPHLVGFNAVNGNISTESTTTEYSYVYADGITKNSLANHLYTKGYDSKMVENSEGDKRHSHMTLFTDYILATTTQETIQFTMSVYDDATMNNPIKTTAFNTQIPVQRNYLTTIIGNVLTTSTDINVSIDDNFYNKVEENPYFVEIWDGKSKNEPKFNAETNTYYVGRASELAWIADYVNAGNTLEGATVEVVGPIDLNCEEWTPIGYGTSFNGTFNGNGWTIANLCYRGKEAGDWCVGLFGCIDGATIKNVSLYNIDIYVDGGCFGALVGVSDNAITIDNVTVEGLVKIEGRVDAADSYYIGTILGTAEGGDGNDDVTISNISINVADGSYIKGGQYVGGVVGRTLGETSMTNIYSNIDVYAYNGIVGGIIGSIQHNSTVDGCVADGNVYRETAEGRTENQYKRIGGIAGMWENTTGKVELVDVEFNGALIATDANGDAMTSFDYAKFVGRGYQTTASKAKGVLYINGIKWVDYNSVEVDALNPFQSALEYDDITISVIDDIVTNNGLGLEVERNVTIDFANNEFNAGSNASSLWYALEINGEYDVTIQNANFTRAGIFAGNNANVVFENGTINHKPERTSRYIFCAQSGSTITVKDGTFTNDRAKNSFFWADAATIIVEGGDFGGVASNKKIVTSNDGQVIIKGGTFNFDPTAWVAEGYQTVKNGAKWVVSAL